MLRTGKILQRNAKEFMRKAVTLSIATMLVIYSFTVFAQDSKKDKWEYTIAPYLLFPNMGGDVTVKGLTGEVDMSTGDIFSNLKLGGMLYFEMSKNNWTIALDALYMSLAKDGQMPITERKVEVNMKEFAFESVGLYRALPWLDIGAGARLVSLDAGLLIEPGEVILPGRDVSDNYTWVDPIIATRLIAPLQGKWNAAVRADIGGFGIGSDFSWQVYPVVGYRFTETFELALSYRALSMDYQKGSDSDLFRYDVTTYGAELGFLFHF